MLLPLELAILAAAVEARRAGEPTFHGFAIATVIQDLEGGRRLTAHGTLYRALSRMETADLLTSKWEAPEVAEAEGRPRRRLYALTGLGEQAWHAAHQARPAKRNTATGWASA